MKDILRQMIERYAELINEIHAESWFKIPYFKKRARGAEAYHPRAEG